MIYIKLAKATENASDDSSLVEAQSIVGEMIQNFSNAADILNMMDGQYGDANSLDVTTATQVGRSKSGSKKYTNSNPLPSIEEENELEELSFSNNIDNEVSWVADCKLSEQTDDALSSATSSASDNSLWLIGEEFAAPSSHA